MALRRRTTRIALVACLIGLGGLAAAAGYLYHVTGTYGFYVLAKRGGSIWTPATPDDPRISPGMRLALTANPPDPTAGPVAWVEAMPGFETAEMPVLADGVEVDRVLLSRFDPARWEFGVHNDPDGKRDPMDWIAATGAKFMINGSYFERTGLPSIPIVDGGIPAGPAKYDARHGAFIAGANRVIVADLADRTWHDAFAGAANATVSYPILIDGKGASRAKGDDHWLANRSFVATDKAGRVMFGTTKDAYLTLNRLGPFLASSPLDLKLALNLDGGPLACQAVDVPGHARDFCGTYEMSVRDGQLSLLRPRFENGRWGLAMAITARPVP